MNYYLITNPSRSPTITSLEFFIFVFSSTVLFNATQAFGVGRDGAYCMTYVVKHTELKYNTVVSYPMQLKLHPQERFKCQSEFVSAVDAPSSIIVTIST